MGVSMSSGQVKYIFTQDGTPTGVGEIEGSLWYKTSTKVLYTYDGATWNQVAVPSGSGDGHITILPWSYDSITAGTWVTGQTATQILQSSIYTSTETQNDEIVYKVYLTGGTYRFFFLGSNGPSSGIINLYLDATLTGTIDLYAAGQTENNLEQITGIVVATAGLYSLKIKMATKNATSSAYGCIIGYMAMIRSA